MAARRRGARRRRVGRAEERKKKMFFSSVGPSWQPDTEPVSRAGLQWADVVERAAGLWPGKILLLFFSCFVFFSIFCFPVLNSNLIFNSVMQGF
jgi:hypothetical protein